MNFTSEDIRTLRDKSGAGMMDCKNALNESNGDIEKAIEWLRKKGINTAQKKSSRVASDGLITINISQNTGIILEINSETDFVARNENFQRFCDDISNTCIQNNIDNLDSLMNANFFNTDKLVKNKLTETVSKLGENIVIKRLKLVKENNSFLQKYLHNSVNTNSGKIGVLLVFSSKDFNKEVDNISRNLCMHIAAMNPQSIDIENLSSELVEKEKSIYKEQLKLSGKPEEIIEKIVNGKLKKYYEDVCLLEQFFVMDTKTKIKDYLNSFNNKNNLEFKIISFFMFKLGQE
ncbi:MAG: translation elongation factor Ts [Pseudomonadota bacterium]|nr:translation elongation factor Ts [Pseudomonadota bacterium]